MRVPPMCEHCHKKEGVARCSHCRRGFHTGQCPNNLQGAAQRLTEDCDLISNGMCWECRRYDPELDDGDSYDLQTEPWYIEWEPSWEDANTMRQLGYEGVVIQTLAARETGQTGRTPQQRPPRDPHMSNKARQGNQGPRLHNTMGEQDRTKCTFITEDTDPHLDIVGTGRSELQERIVPRRLQTHGGEKQDTSRNMVSVHDPTGRAVGMITPERLALLHQHFCHVMQTRRDVVDSLQPKTFAEEVAALLRRYKEGVNIPGTNRKVDLTNHWATPTGIYDMLQEKIPGLCQERFASPLNCHPHMQRYWTCFERDQLFGALHDAYKSRWTGYSVANPEYDAKEMYKAVSWAVHSAHNTAEPTLTVFVLPAWTDASNTAYMKWVKKMPNTCKLLATIPKKSFKFLQPQATTLGQAAGHTGHPKWDVNVLLVGNHPGFKGCFPEPESSSHAMKLALIQAVNEHAHPSVPLTWTRLQHHWPTEPPYGTSEHPGEEYDSILYRPPAKVLAVPSDESAPKLPPANELSLRKQTTNEQLGLQRELPLKYNWNDFVYTDGSQCKIEIGPEGRETVRLGSAVYVPPSDAEDAKHIGIQATAPTRHNTAYRAELIAILAAVRMGHNRIMTDSVNSIHAIKAAINYPAKIRYHRHKNLLDNIKAAIMELEGQVQLVKVRGHAGIPGNEFADDIANAVAKSGQADMDFSMEASNSRPSQVWPMQSIWEEDELSETGLRQKWQQVENLDDALIDRVTRSGDIRLGDALTTTVYYQANKKALDHLSEPYIGSWLTLSGITESMKCTRVKYLTGQLPTAKNLHRYGVSKTSLCPCCAKHQDGGHHAVAWCPGIMGIVQEKHNAAVRLITKAIANGDLGADNIVYNDGGTASKWSRAGIAHLHRSAQDIPADLLTKAEFQTCRSRPDIIMYRPKKITRTSDGQWRVKPAVITLVEVKYTRDTDPSRTMRDPHTQHSRLHEVLREKHPSATIERRNVILGVAGAIFTEETVRPLELLGVRGQHLRHTVQKLQRHAIQALHNTWKSRQEKIRNARAKRPEGCEVRPVTELERQAIHVLQDQRRVRQEKARNASTNRAPVEGHTLLGGGVQLGGRVGGDARDVGGGARRAKKAGEG